MSEPRGSSGPDGGQGPCSPSLLPGVAGPRRRGPARRPAGTRRPVRPRARRRPPVPPAFPPPPPAASGPGRGDEDHAPRLPQLRRRVLVGAGLLAVWGALIVGRLVQTQIFQHEAMVARANGQHRQELDIPPFRGGIHDRSGRPLALTIAADSVYVVPPDYTGLDRAEAARRLSRCLAVPERLVARRLRRASRFSWLKRKAAPAEVACAAATGFPVGTIEEYGRFYPGGGLAAQLVGHVGVDNNGLGGIEHALDAVIRGEPGRRTVWTDGRRTGRASRVVRDSRPGADLELTLDSHTQAVAEEELARGLEETSAVAGAVILIEAATGEVLAMASAPSFDPNRVRDFPPATLVNRTITDPYEPGSVFKMFTAAAALNEGVTHENERFETWDGRYRIGSRIVRDWKPLGPLSFAGVIRQSSNIGTLQVAARLGSGTLRSYLRAFGFGEATGLPLGGESRGIVPASDHWRPIRLATVSFGQGIAVTPVQLVQGVNAIANRGVRVPLRLIRRVGSEVAPFDPGRRVVSAQTAERVRILLAEAVASGTGGAAAVEGFRVAGKTGTAQKAASGGYSPTDYIASFAGFAPAREPLFTGVVILDAKRPHHSGTNAARVFGRIAERVLWRYRKTGSETPRLVGSGSRPLRTAPVWPGDRTRLLAVSDRGGPPAVPHRFPARDAAALALRLAPGPAYPPGFRPPLEVPAPAPGSGAPPRTESAAPGAEPGIRPAARSLALSAPDSGGPPVRRAAAASAAREAPPGESAATEAVAAGLRRPER